MKRFSFLVSLVFIITISHAQIPKIINYQGVLLGQNEIPVSEGDYKLTFSIYDETDNVLWSEIHSTVYVVGGMFHVLLGTVNPLDLPFNKEYYLGIKVGNDTELQPRMMMTSACYSFKAEDANTVAGIEVSITPKPKTLLPLDSSGKFPSEVFSGGGVSGNFLKKGVPDTSRGTSALPMLLFSNLGDGDGVTGRNIGGNGRGIVGRSDKNDGVVGWSGASDKSGVFGHGGDGYGVTGRSENNYGVQGLSIKNDGVYGESGTNNKSGVYGHHGGSGNGVFGGSTDGAGVKGVSVNNEGIYGLSYAENKSGVFGSSPSGNGVTGRSDAKDGILGVTTSSNAEHVGVHARNEGSGPAIYASAGTNNVAAIFDGNVKVRNRTTQTVLIELGEGLDYAEGFDVSNHKEISHGTVLIIDPKQSGRLAISNSPYDTKVAGIVAGAKGLGSGIRLAPDLFDYDVALAGRVYCNVDAIYGKVSPGDLLTTSPRPGYAMVVKDYHKAQGAILGKAMEALPAGEKGQILVLVTLQ